MKSNLKKVYTCCNNCESTNSTLVTTGTDFECGVTDDVFNIVRCSDCGLLYMNPRPDLSELPVIYPSHYAPYNVEDNYDDRQRRSLYYKMRYKGVLSFIEKSMLNLFPDKRDIVMLDIGCADGHTLSCFKRIGFFNIDTYGVDISAEAVEKTRAKGHKVYLGRFEDVDLPLSFFDFVYASHVIEHVPDPKAFTRKVYDLLKPGGIFGFWTPNTASLDAKWTETETPDASFTKWPSKYGDFWGMSGTGNATSAYSIRQTLAGFAAGVAFQVTLKLSAGWKVNPSGEIQLGVALGDNPAMLGGNYTYWFVASSSNAFLVNEYNGATNISSSTSLERMGATLYLHIQRTSGNVIRWWVSLDGITWHMAGSATRSFDFTYLYLRAVGSTAAGNPSSLFIDWVRVNDARFTQPV